MSQQNGCGSAYLRVNKFSAILLATVFFCCMEQGAAFAADAVASENIGGVEADGASTTLPGDAAKNVGVNEEDTADSEASPEPVFALAPILWGGDVSASLHRTKFERDSANLQTTQAGNLRAITYVWQPWLAQVMGGLGVTNSKNTYGKNLNKDVSWSGNGELSLMPFSHFPFLASYFFNNREIVAGTPMLPLGSDNKRSDLKVKQRYRPRTRASDSYISYNKVHNVDVSSVSGRLDRINSRLEVQHDYRSPKTASIFGIGYSRNTNGGSGQEFNATTKMLANYTKRLKHHYFDVETINTDGEFSNEGTRHNQITAQHKYRPDSLLSVQTSGIVSQSELLSIGQNFSNTRNLQLNSSASWQPDAELPFHVSGSLRGFGSVRDTRSATNSSQSLLGMARVNYAATPNLNYRVSETLGVTRTKNSSTITTVTGGSAIYNSGDTKLGRAFHKWNASGTVDYHTSSKSSSGSIKSWKAGQGLRLSHRLGNGAVDYNFNQNLSIKDHGSSSQNGNLVHNGGMVWKPAIKVKSLSGSGSINLVDKRSFGNTLTNLQTANLAANVQHKTTVYAGTLLSGASALWSVHNTGLSSKTFKLRTGYIHPRVFNVAGLSYSLTADVSKYQTNGARNRANLRNGYSISQKLEYAVGRFYMKLNGDIIKKSDVKYTLIVLKVGRTFGQL